MFSRAACFACLFVCLAIAPSTLSQVLPAPTAEALSVEKTPIGVIVQDARARAILEKELPTIVAYLDRLGSLTLAEAAPRSQGRITPEKLRDLQAAFDALK